MAAQHKPIRDKKIMVEIPHGRPRHTAHDKDMPDDLTTHPDYNNYMWVGNFGLRDDKGNAAPPRLPWHYTVLVEKVPGKDKLFYWNGQEIKGLPIERQEIRDGRDYAVAKLDLGDPPVAWG